MILIPQKLLFPRKFLSLLLLLFCSYYYVDVLFCMICNFKEFLKSYFVYVYSMCTCMHACVHICVCVCICEGPHVSWQAYGGLRTTSGLSLRLLICLLLYWVVQASSFSTLGVFILLWEYEHALRSLTFICVLRNPNSGHPTCVAALLPAESSP